MPEAGAPAVVAQVPVVTADLDADLFAVASGQVAVPAAWEGLDSLVYRDPTDDTNDTGTVLRFYRDGVDSATAPPDYEFYARGRRKKVAEDGTELAVIHGPNTAWRADQIRARNWDYPANPTTFPDWVYAGENALPAVDGQTNEAQAFYILNATGGTFTLTFDTQTTGTIAYPATPSAIETALEALPNIIDVAVGGGGTAADPWTVEFVDPGGQDVATLVVNTGGLTGPGPISATVNTTQQGGQGLIEPWHKIANVYSGNQLGTYTSNGWRASTGGEPAGVGGYTLRVDGIAGYVGPQILVAVQPGGLYQASVPVWSPNTVDTFRLVIRDLNENLIAASAPFAGRAVATANTWDTFTIADVQIPDGVTTVVFRLAYVGGGDPAPFFVDIHAAQLAEGMAAATAGKIVGDQHADFQARGVGTDIVKGFSDTVDSDGAAWDLSLSYTVRRGFRFGSHLLDGLADLGYEWALAPDSPTTLRLDLWNPGGRGQDRTGDNHPAFVLGSGLTGGEVALRQPNFTRVTVEGAGGLWEEREAAAAVVARWGRREEYVAAPDLTDAATIGRHADEALAAELANGVAAQTTFDVDDSLAPYLHFGLGDTVNFTIPPLPTHGRRVHRIVLRLRTGGDGERWTCEVTASRLFAGEASAWEGLRQLLLAFKGLKRPAAAAAIGLGGGGGEAPDIVVAGANARPEIKASATYVCDGQDDQVEIQAAIDEVYDDAEAGTYGGRVLLAGHGFNVSVPDSGQAILVRQGVTLQGMGWGTRIFYANIPNVPDVPVIQTVGVGSSVRDVTVERRAGLVLTANAPVPLSVFGSRQKHVNVRVVDSWRAVHVVSATAIDFVGLLVENVTQDGVRVVNSTDVNFDPSCRFWNVGTRAVSYDGAVDELTMVGCKLSGCGAIIGPETGTATCQQVTLAALRSRFGTLRAVHLRAGTANTVNAAFTVVGCQIDQGAAAAGLLLEGGTNHSVHSNDLFEVTDGHGVELLNVREALVEGNHITGFWLAATDDAIRVGGTSVGVSVGNNKVAQSHLFSATASFEHGVNVVGAGVSGTRIYNNDIAHTNSTPIADTGTGTLVGVQAHEQNLGLAAARAGGDTLRWNTGSGTYTSGP